jgi:isopentenyl-diphosphate delta-isomerase
MQEDHVILVDENNRAVGTMPKMEAHERGYLHRAFSIFVFNNRRELLLQRRAPGKYHSPLLWSNTCCSHPLPEETTDSATNRRLQEEMGLDCMLEHALDFTYRAHVGGGLIEHEYDQVFIGITNDIPAPAPLEADAWRYVSMAQIEMELANENAAYTFWFKLVYNQVWDHMQGYWAK